MCLNYTWGEAKIYKFHKVFRSMKWLKRSKIMRVECTLLLLIHFTFASNAIYHLKDVYIRHCVDSSNATADPVVHGTFF